MGQVFYYKTFTTKTLTFLHTCGISLTFENLLDKNNPSLPIHQLMFFTASEVVKNFAAV